MGRTIRRWRWSRWCAWSSPRRWSRSRQRRWCRNEKRHCDQLRSKDRLPPPPSLPEFRFFASTAPRTSCPISRTAQRRGRAAEGRRARTRWPSSTTTAAGPMPSSTISPAASPGCWSRKRASSPATACCCAGPTATPCSPPGSASSRPAAWWSRPCRCSARRDRDGDRPRRDQPRDRRQPLHRRLPRGG